MTRSPDWSALSPTYFEELVFWILVREGFHNVSWYGRSGGDRGRDIVCDRTELLGTRVLTKKCVIQCKRYTGAVSRSTIFEDIAKCTEFDPDYFIIATSGIVSAGTKDWLAGQRHQFNIVLWEALDLEIFLSRHQDLRKRFFGVPIDESSLFEQLSASSSRLQRMSQFNAAPEVRKWLSAALDLSVETSSAQVTTGHLLLAMTGPHDSQFNSMLAKHGIQSASLRSELLVLLNRCSQLSQHRAPFSSSFRMTVERALHAEDTLRESLITERLLLYGIFHQASSPSVKWFHRRFSISEKVVHDYLSKHLFTTQEWSKIEGIWDGKESVVLFERTSPFEQTELEPLGPFQPDDRQVAAPIVAEGLGSEEAEIRQFAAQALGRIGPSAKATVPALVALLEDPDPGVRAATAEALGFIENESAAASLGRTLSDENGEVRRNAVRSIGRIASALAAEEAFLALGQASKHEDVHVRRIAIEFLQTAYSKGNERIELLSSATKDDDPEVRKLATEAIAKSSLADSGVINALLMIARSDNEDETELRLRALKALERFRLQRLGKYASRPSAVIEVRNTDIMCDVGYLDGQGDFTIPIPDDEPIRLQVLSPRELSEIDIPHGTTVNFALPGRELRVLTLENQVYELGPLPDPSMLFHNQLRRRVPSSIDLADGEHIRGLYQELVETNSELGADNLDDDALIVMLSLAQLTPLSEQPPAAHLLRAVVGQLRENRVDRQSIFLQAPETVVAYLLGWKNPSVEPESRSYLRAKKLIQGKVHSCVESVYEYLTTHVVEFPDTDLDSCAKYITDSFLARECQCGLAAPRMPAQSEDQSLDDLLSRLSVKPMNLRYRRFHTCFTWHNIQSFDPRKIVGGRPDEWLLLQHVERAVKGVVGSVETLSPGLSSGMLYEYLRVQYGAELLRRLP